MEARCLGGGGDGEGELRDSKENEERGIADDGDDDEGGQVGSVGQRVKKAFGLAPTRFSASPDCRFSSVASISKGGVSYGFR